MGTWELAGQHGQRMLFGVTASGIYLPLADAAMPTPTYSHGPAMILKSCTLTVGGYTPKISQITITQNNPVEQA